MRWLRACARCVLTRSLQYGLDLRASVQNCHKRPKFGAHKFCGKTCAAQAAAKPARAKQLPPQGKAGPRNASHQKGAPPPQKAIQLCNVSRSIVDIDQSRSSIAHLRWTSICSTVVKSPSSIALIIAASRALPWLAPRRPSYLQRKGYRRGSLTQRAHRTHLLIMLQHLHQRNLTRYLNTRPRYLKVTILINLYESQIDDDPLNNRGFH